ncbi:unnamed protein product [Rhodiola kirilowii]
MYEYVEKFIALEKSCCNLGLPEKLFVEYMLDGLRKLDRKLLDASAGGILMDLSPAGVRRKIMAVAESERFQDESTKEEEYTRTRNVSRVEPPSIQTKPCEFCAATDHKTDECPTLVADDQADVNAVGDYQSYGNRPGAVRQYGAATTNQGVNGQPWKSNNQQHQAQREPVRQNAPQQNQQPYQPPYRQYQQNGPSQYQHRGPINNQPGPSNHSSNKPLEKIVEELAATTKGDIADLKKQMSQLTTLVSDLANSVSAGRLPSQTVQNPKGNVSAVTLRSARRASGPSEDENQQKPEDEAAEPSTFGQDEIGPDLIPSAEISQPGPVPITENSNVQLPLPFPVQVPAPKKYVMDREVWELFSKVEINIPLLEAIKQIPRYSKFLKELCTNRRRGTQPDQELMSMNLSAVIQRKVPPKCGDPGTYTIPCTIGNIRIENCMLDLGASINVLPYSIYSCLRIVPLEPAGLTIQLANRSFKQPEGKIEDVLVQMGELVFPADFYLLKMENCGPTDHAPILLGRPFLKTSKMKIDCDTGTLSMEVEGEVFSFDIFRAMKHPTEYEAVHALDTLDDLVQEVHPERGTDPLKQVIEEAVYSPEDSYEHTEAIMDALDQLEIAQPLTPRYEVNAIRLFKSQVCLPSVVQAPTVELKPLPSHLKYAFLGANSTLQVIIKSGLEADQEHRLIGVLTEHKLAIGWTVADIKGISPAVCMHRILLDDGAKPSREPQRRLNPIMMEVVQKEIQKLLDADVIYPISDSQWVSPVHVVPKKTGITVRYML